MIINHNMASVNAHRNMGINQANSSKSMTKLSSGLRINTAADDAAGLSISEKMRAQVRGLDKAATNAQDGISLIQTAEGALNETESILQRMRELTTQAANGTNTTEDTDAIEEELTQLTTEIDRIATDTEFNTKGLLDGSFSAKFQIGANANQQVGVAINEMSSNALGITGGVQLNKVAAANTGKLAEGTYKVDGTDVKDAKDNVVGTIDGTGKITLADGATEIALGHAVTDGSTIKMEKDGATVTLAKGNSADVSKVAAGSYTVSGSNLLNGDKLVGTIAGTTLTFTDTTKGTADLTQLGLVAADVADTKTFTVKGIDVSSSDNASGALDTLDSAISSVSKERSKLGAMQNRLEHTIANLGTSSENLTSAESRIRDVDMAKEMSTFSKNNILAQAAQSMLAQANQQPQQVLQLLQ